MELINNFYTYILEVFEKGVFGLKIYELGLTFLIILLSLSIRGLFARFIVRKIGNIISKTGNKIDDKLFDSLTPPLKFLPIVFAFLFVTLYVDIDSTLGVYLQKINKTLATIFVFWLIHQAVNPLSSIFSQLDRVFSKALIVWLIKSIKYLILFLGAVATLEVWGIKIGPIIAGLGLFGVAVALGAQDMFKNLISGILILMEKSFTLGDVVNVPGYAEGTVEHIGFRSTRIRKFDSTPISIPNYIFAEIPIINYSERNHRRINWTIGLEYNSSLEQIKTIIKSIEEFIKMNSNFIVNDDFNSYIRLEKFNDSSIDILVCCFTKTKDYKEYLEVKEELAFKIKQIVEINEASFAFPSQSIYIEKNNYNN